MSGMSGITGSAGGAAIGPSRMVPTAIASDRVAPDGLDSATMNVSLPSARVSRCTRTAMTFSVSPGAKVTAPAVAV